jgi:hypothetical protein
MPYDLSIVGWFTEGQLQVLESIAKTVPENGVVVEIGSLYGRSTVCWAMTCPLSATIYAIDLFNEEYTDTSSFSNEEIQLHNYPKPNVVYRQRELFDENTKKYKNINKIVGCSPYEIDYPGNNIDILFLDAFHTNPSDWNNIKYFLPYVKIGGLISGHDYSNDFPDILENVKRLEELFEIDAIIESQIWQIRVTKKIEML